MADDLTPAHRAAVEVMAKAMRQNVTAEPIPESTLASAVVRGAATAALRALIEAGFWVARWEPIETAPKDGTRMLLHQPQVPEDSDPVTVGAWLPAYEDPGWLMETGEVWLCPTHWTPLPPSPPEADNAE